MATRYGVLFVDLCIIIAVLIGLPEVSEAGARDGERRQGIFIGVGVGSGYTAFTKEVSRGSVELFSDRTKKGAAATDLKLGMALSEDFWTYYVNRAAWFGQESVLVMSMSHHVGMTVFLQKTRPALYWLASVGLSNWKEQGTVPGWGLGISAGLGYELPKGWSVEATVTYGFAEHTPASSFFSLATETKWVFSSVLITINKVYFLGY